MHESFLGDADLSGFRALRQVVGYALQMGRRALERSLSALFLLLPCALSLECHSSETPGALDDAANEGSDAANERGEADAGPTCSGPLADFNGNLNCLNDWPADTSDFCTKSGTSDNWVFSQGCGHRVAEIDFIDQMARCYYDETTGKLVAIAFWQNGHFVSCSGPSDFGPLACNGDPLGYCVPSDAGSGGPDATADAADSD